MNDRPPKPYQDKKYCSGCGACAAICHKHAITMKSDEEGFLYPTIDKQKCIFCYMCEKVCDVNKYKGTI